MNNENMNTKPSLLSHAGASQQFLALIGLCLISGFIVSLVGIVIGLLLFDLNFLKLGTLMKETWKPGVMGFLKLSQFFSAIGLFVLPPIILVWMRGKPVFSELRISVKPHAGWVLFCMLLMVVQLPLINGLGALNAEMVFPDFLKGLENWMRVKEDETGVMTKAFLDMPTYLHLAEALLVMAVIPALGEELLFRSAMQPIISKWTKMPHLSIWITAFIFSFIHFQFFGFLPRFLMGAFLGYLFYWTGNIWYSIAAHFVNNGLTVVMYFLVQHKYIEETTDDLGVGQGSFPEIAVSLALAVGGIMLIRKKFGRNYPMPAN